MARSGDDGPPRRASESAFLLPAYDEAVLTYPALNVPAATGHPYAEHPDPFWTWIVHRQVNVGMWKRTVARDRVTVETRLADSIGEEGHTAVFGAAEQLARFLGRDLDYREGSGRPHIWRPRPTLR